LILSLSLEETLFPRENNHRGNRARLHDRVDCAAGRLAPGAFSAHMSVGGGQLRYQPPTRHVLIFPSHRQSPIASS
jgi:hypothetical protein